MQELAARLEELVLDQGPEILVAIAPGVGGASSRETLGGSQRKIKKKVPPRGTGTP